MFFIFMQAAEFLAKMCDNTLKKTSKATNERETESQLSDLVSDTATFTEAGFLRRVGSEKAFLGVKRQNCFYSKKARFRS